MALVRLTIEFPLLIILLRQVLVTSSIVEDDWNAISKDVFATVDPKEQLSCPVQCSCGIFSIVNFSYHITNCSHAGLKRIPLDVSTQTNIL